MKHLLWISLLSLTMIAPLKAADPVGDPALTRLDNARQAIEQIEASLARKDLSDIELTNLRLQIDQPEARITAVIEELTPKQTAIKTRLDQLGPKPGEKDPPESPGVTSERVDQEKLFNQLDETVRKGKLLAVQAEQLKGLIGVRRRTLFTHALFERSSSILSPALWYGVAKELPLDLVALQTVFGDWYSVSVKRLSTLTLFFLAGLIALCALLYQPLMRVAAHIVNRDENMVNPSRLRQVVAALWLAIVTAAVPIGIMAGLTIAFDSFDLLTPRLQPITKAFFEAGARIALTFAMSRALLAPRRPNWRLLALASPTALRIAHLVIAVAVVVSIAKMLESINDVIAATLPLSVATRAVGALTVALVIGVSLRRMMAAQADAEETSFAPGSDHDLYGPLRLLAWAAIAIIVAAVVVGYVAFAAFLVDQIVWMTGIGTVLYLLLLLNDEGMAAALQPESNFGRSIISAIGIRRESLEQIGILFAGLLRVALIVIAGVLVLAPWGIQSDDMLGYVKAAFFGFKVGDVSISLSTIAISILLFLIGFVVTRAFQNWLDAKFLPRTQLDVGLRNSIRTSLGYVGVTIAAAIALSHVGLSFDKFAIVAGALSVGIGFGLQSIVSNFVSGLILLWERAIRVGDWIVVGEEQGFVRRINVRSTEIETFDRATVIMPNSNIVSGVVKNWVRTDRVGRVMIDVRAPYDCDPEQVRGLLVACAKENDTVLSIPAPLVMFSHFGESALQFQLICFVDDVLTAALIKSDLHYAIFAKLKEAGITMPYAQRDVTIRGLESLGLALRNQETG